MFAQPTNIFTGTKGLGGALSNMTELAFRKGSVKQHYPITWCGKNYEDVERAYQLNKMTYDPAHNDALMTDLIATKLLTYRFLFEAIRNRGGVKWLEACQHEIGPGPTLWTGKGNSSRLIRCYVEAYCYALYLIMGDDQPDIQD